MLIRNVSNGVLHITGISSLPSRKRYKLLIYLNSLKECTVEEQGDIVEIRYSFDDERFLIWIQELYSFSSSLTDDLHLSNDLGLKIQQASDAKKEKQALIASLRDVKEGLHNEEDFKQFCEICDANLCIKLRPYQYKAAYLLSLGKGGFDFSVPGSGKTIITYAVYTYLKLISCIDEMLVVGPLSSYNAWFDEFSLCFGREPIFKNLAVLTTAECKTYLKSSPKYHGEVTFINIDKIRLLTKEISFFLSTSKVLLVLDEAHKIKAPTAKATQSAIAFSKHAAARILLTGTPMPNGYEDLFSLATVFSPYEAILPFRYPKLKSMTQNGATKSEFERLKTSLSPYYSRISKKYLIETKELLPPEFHTIRVSMTSEQRKLYDRLDNFCGKLDEGIDEDFLLSLKKAALIRKMQISANPMLLKKGLLDCMDELYAQYSGKSDDATMLIDADKKVMEIFKSSEINRVVNQFANGTLQPNKNRLAIDIVQKLVSTGKKVLVWDIFVDNMSALRQSLDKLFPGAVELINGSVSMVERQQALYRFRNGSSMILIANPATLAESVSLHRACQVALYVNRNFNCAQYIQSKDRIHRINMPAGTTATYYIIENEECVDRAVSEKLEEKENRMLLILDSNDIIVGGAEYDDINIMSEKDIDDSYRR